MRLEELLEHRLIGEARIARVLAGLKRYSVLAEQVFVDADQQGLVVRDGAVEVEKDCACRAACVAPIPRGWLWAGCGSDRNPHRIHAVDTGILWWCRWLSSDRLETMPCARCWEPIRPCDGPGSRITPGTPSMRSPRWRSRPKRPAGASRTSWGRRMSRSASADPSASTDSTPTGCSSCRSRPRRGRSSRPTSTACGRSPRRVAPTRTCWRTRSTSPPASCWTRRGTRSHWRAGSTITWPSFRPWPPRPRPTAISSRSAHTCSAGAFSLSSCSARAMLWA